MFTIVQSIILVYLLLGILFAIPFLIIGIHKVDEAAKGGSFWLRLILFPATIFFWPTLLRKWIASRTHS
ncbi:MAG: hypothetical protein AAGC85_23635 [Bacteroidota bacterium]